MNVNVRDFVGERAMPGVSGGSGLGAQIRAEWTKMASLRAVPLLLALTCVLPVVLGAVSGWSVRNAFDKKLNIVRADFSPVNSGHYPLLYAQVLVIAFAVLVVGSEYGSGTIRASLAAVPRRGVFYLGKVVAGAVPAAVVAVIAAVGGFLATQWGLGDYAVAADDPDILPTTAGAAVYLVLMYAVSVGVATVLRGTALASAVLIVLVMVLSPLLNRFPTLRPVARYLPDHAGTQLMTVGESADPGLSPLAGLVVLVAWAAVALLGGYLALRAREV
ncbi:ABC transporter permease subunit [Streptoalloteichus hindustanus]|uniref:ABC-2 family transporter protein n=1 Tax=Streptoalloteichus hindustanus TaxID=2017 RepID=A0A1M5D2H3_STRHI|nr:ABC transporter permease subunit [Streptoalloteichus hindustanus]SHF61156.1 ABC-2 family transporter protein [Streptoalloteichus hindustanus]